MPPYAPSSPYARPPHGYYDQSPSRGPERQFDSECETRRYAATGYMRQGEQVEVRIRGDKWIVGLLVSSLHLISSYFGKGYDVEYKDQRGQPYRSQFRQEDVRPLPR